MKEQRFNKHEDPEPRLPYPSALDIVTQHHALSGSNNRILFPHISGDGKSKSNVTAGLVSGKSSVFRLQKATFLLCPHMVEGGRDGERERERENLFLLLQGHSLSNWGQPFWPHLTFIIS